MGSYADDLMNEWLREEVEERTTILREEKNKYYLALQKIRDITKKNWTYTAKVDKITEIIEEIFEII